MKKLICILLLSLISINAYCYEVDVHEQIAKNAIASSKTGQYLKNNLGISLDTFFNNRKVKDWIAQGSRWEDDNLTMRWLNHFYDPTTGKGLNTAGLIIYGDPSLKWGKLALNAWDWENARDYYYSALTKTNRTDREKAFADTFRALGQIIHLIQDTAVPAHVRNDPHNIPFIDSQREMYEHYTQSRNLSYGGYSAVDLATFDTIDAFWLNSGKGLSEYTNSNFLSRNTNIDDNQYVSPVSTGEWTTTETVYDPDYGWIYVDVKYLRGYATDNYRPGTSTPISRLSAFSYFDYEMNKYLGRHVYSLNNYIHKEYSDLLIPRAVGYSAGLLNYFFRGEIEAVNPEAVKDSSGNITGAKLKIKNKTFNEAMRTGKLIISCQYKPSGSTDLVYGISGEVSLNETIAYGNESNSEFTFTFASSIPSDAEEIKYWLVYRGILGNEEDAVVGKSIKLKAWPKGGMIQKWAYNNRALVYILDRDKIENYQIEIPIGEFIVKAAFDEGDIAVVRALSLTRVDEEIIWKLYAFSYKPALKKYQQDSVQEIFKVSVSPTTKTEFNFTLTGSWLTAKWESTFSGFIEERLEYSAAISDFFVPLGRDTKLLKQENKIFFLSTPFITKYEYDFSNPSGCSVTSNRVEEYIEGSREYPICRKYGHTTNSCSGNSSYDITEHCETVGYSYWENCEGTAVFVPTSAWLYDSLEYAGFLKQLSNPLYDGNTPAWTARSDGPCLLFDYNAHHVSGSLTGKILSDHQIVAGSYFKQGSFGEIVENPTAIEPDGTELNAMPFLMLRQTGGYSMLENLGSGEVRNHTSFSNVPSDKPILLNREGNGFKISFGKPPFGTTLKIGVQYDETTQDFKVTSSVEILNIKPDFVMDIMVEYE